MDSSSARESSNGDLVNDSLSDENNDEKLEFKLETDNNCTDLVEFILENIGDFGYIQKMLAAYLFLFVSPIMDLQVLHQLMFSITPPFKCDIQMLDGPAKVLEKNEFFPINNSKCEYHKLVTLPDNQTGVFNQSLQAWETLSCSKWVYNYSGNYFVSATSQYDWVCSDSWKEAVAQSAFWVGSFIGLVFFLDVSDKYGRKPITIITYMWAGITSMATVITSNYYGFLIIRFICGMPYWFMSTTPLCWALEFVRNEKRKYIIFIWSLSFPMAWTVLPWFIVALEDWKLYLIITSVLFFVNSFISFLIPESISWYVVNKNTEEVIKHTKLLCKMNGNDITESLELQLKERLQELKTSKDVADRNVTTKSSLKKIWKYKRMRNQSIILMICMFIAVMGFAGLTYVSSSMTKDPITSFSLSSILEISIPFFQLFLLDYIGRKWSISLFFCTTAAMVFTASFLTKESHPLEFMICTAAARVFGTATFQTIGPYSIELGPTEVRTMLNALRQTIGALAAILAPLTIYLKHFNDAVPLIILGVSAIIGSILILQLPETTHENLAQTVEEGEKFGKDQTFFHIPCLMKKKELSGNANKSNFPL